MERGSERSDGSDAPCAAEHLVRQLLLDEAALNDALEMSKTDYSHMPAYADLRYRVQVELGAPLDEAGADPGMTLASGLRALVQELEQKWELARQTEDEDILELCETPRPPASALFDELFG